MCGASSEQKQTYQQQSDLFKQMSDQMSSIFGQSSGVFNDLTSALAPIVAGGPNQKGFSPGEESALKSQAISDTGVAYKNARQAVGEAGAARGGGTVALPGGAQIGQDLSLANSASGQTASELNTINQNNYTTGRQNFFNAISPLESAPNVFNPATGAGEAAVGAGNAAASTANQISQSNNSWVSAVTGMLGGITSNLIAPGGIANPGGKGTVGKDQGATI